MTAIILQFNAGLRRAACPLAAPRLVGALVGVGMHYALLPGAIFVAAVAGYHEALFAVLRPQGTHLGRTAETSLSPTGIPVGHHGDSLRSQKSEHNAAFEEV